MTTRKIIDWEAVEIQYRAGIRPLKSIGKEFDVSDAAIIKRARRDGWERDLSAKIRAKAEAKVSAAAVSASVSEQTKANEREIVEANATMQRDIILAHRTDLQKLRARAADYEAELNDCTDELGKRVSILRQLADTQKSIIGLERQAFGIDADKNNSNGSSIEDVLAEIRAKESVA